MEEIVLWVGLGGVGAAIVWALEKLLHKPLASRGLVLIVALGVAASVFFIASLEPGFGIVLALWPLTVPNMLLPPLLGGLIYREFRSRDARRA